MQIDVILVRAVYTMQLDHFKAAVLYLVLEPEVQDFRNSVKVYSINTTIALYSSV